MVNIMREGVPMKEYHTCDCCGSEIEETNAVIGISYHLCENCYNKDYTRCDKCSDIIDITDIYWHKGAKYCALCYFKNLR